MTIANLIIVKKKKKIAKLLYNQNEIFAPHEHSKSLVLKPKELTLSSSGRLGRFCGEYGDG